MKRKYTDILFDLDGTLTDSGEGIMNSASYAFRELGLEVPSRTELRKFVGPPLWESFLNAGVPAEKTDEAVRLYRYSYNQLGGKFDNHVYEGIPELLAELKTAGMKLYVATSKPESLSKEILAKFELTDYFEYIAGATFDHSRETKAAVIQYLLDSIGGAGSAVMIGDTEFDVKGASELGIPCIGVSWGYGSINSMTDAGAKAVSNTPEELGRLILCEWNEDENERIS